MSRNGTLLLLPADYDLPPYPLAPPWAGRTPRSSWLSAVEAELRQFYPHASTADLALTARTYAPFPLAQPGVR
jgi:hypothetical protein